MPIDYFAMSINDLIAAVTAIETELGIVPAGAYQSVRARLDILEARINNPTDGAPNVLNPFYIGNTGVSIQTDVGDPNVLDVLAVPGSLYLREDAIGGINVYSFGTDGYWDLVGATAPPPSPPILNLGAAATFGVLGASTVTNTGATNVGGDLGLYPGTSVTGFPPGTVSGTQHITDTIAHNAQLAVTAAFIAGNALSGGITISGDLGGQTLAPGVYTSASTIGITGTVTLDAGGNANAYWVFQIGSAMTTASSSVVLLTNGALPANVFWLIGSSATIGTGSTFVGNILALASITANTGANFTGRLLAQTAAVTLDDNQIVVPASGGGTAFTAAGDLSGTNTTQTVIGIQGIPVVSTVPLTGQVLEYNGTDYVPTTLPTFDTVQIGNNADVVVTSTTTNVSVGMKNLTAAHTVTLPAAPTVGQEVTIKDLDGSSATHNIVVNGNSNNIDTVGTYTMTTATGFVSLTIIYFGATGWGVV